MTTRGKDTYRALAMKPGSQGEVNELEAMILSSKNNWSNKYHLQMWETVNLREYV